MTTEEIITSFGGTKRLAEICNVSAGAVSQWKKTGIPDYRLQFLRLLRPEFFAESVSKTQEAA